GGPERPAAASPGRCRAGGLGERADVRKAVGVLERRRRSALVVPLEQRDVLEVIRQTGDSGDKGLRRLHRVLPVHIGWIVSLTGDAAAAGCTVLSRLFRVGLRRYLHPRREGVPRRWRAARRTIQRV